MQITEVHYGETKRQAVRESIGLSTDSSTVYGKKPYRDQLLATKPTTDLAFYGGLMLVLDTNTFPSMLIRKDAKVFFGKKNAIVYAIDPKKIKRPFGHIKSIIR